MKLLDLHNFSRLLRTCCNIQQGKQLHLFLFKSGLLQSLSSSLFIGNCLLQMYAKCGHLNDAHRLFDEMPYRNCFSWNSLIEAYLKSGTNKDISLQLFNSIPHKNEFSWNSIISSYAKSGDLHVARELFNKMPVKNGITWNSMINGYARIGCHEEALNLFKSLNNLDCPSLKDDTFILATVIRICANLAASDHGKQIHTRLIINNVDFDPVMVSSLVNMYAKCGDLDSASHFLNSFQEKPDGFSLSALISGYAKCGRLIDARKFFDNSSGDNCNIVLWNSMIAGYVDNNQGVEAINLFNKMRTYGIREDPSTLASVLTACASLGIVINGKQIHGHGLKLGFIHELIISSVVIDMYSKCGSPNDACRFFEELENYDTILLNSMINLYSNYRRVEDARRIFEMMPSRSLITWNSMIVGYSQNGCAIEALNLFCHMHRLDLRMDKVSIASVISSCASTCALRLGEQIFALATVIGLESDQIISTSLIDLYSKCGYIEDGRRLFDEMIKSDEVPWNSMLMGYSTNGYGTEALKLFEEMRNAGVAPNNITFTGVFSACDHCGLVEEGRRWFDSMKEEFNIEPGIEHFSCMIDMFSRAGYLEEAVNLIDQMPFEADASMWSSVLRGCMADGNEALAMKIAERIIELNPKSSSVYVQLASIHATSGDWERSAQVRRTMRDRRIQKSPGQSWVDN
ncbi:Pentatricopeptide repeat [Macleaya cordata]|uniref:Pentatricopeptide repeat n=1 Tax=Macleaya cordata TaxID=56857 RepID=A0A200Q9V5_MACCD|nr:Pentatricopeptide repeat [Macleaya cordata]